jgi:calcium-translocating P-type ATPase
MEHFPAALAEAERLGVSVDQGLDEPTVRAHRARFGENRLPPIAPESVLSMFIGALADKTLLILMGAAALSIAVEFAESLIHLQEGGRYIDGFAILAAVLIASLVTTINQARAQKQFRLLSKEREDFGVKVKRDGRVAPISVHDLVVGDIVLIETGDRSPADGVLLSGVELALDESMLTGESVPKDKGADDLELKGGSTVTQGTGAMLVTAVGKETEIGKLQLTLEQPKAEVTPLQERLSKLADRIGVFGLLAAVLTFAALTISGFARHHLPLELSLRSGSQLLEFAIVAVTIVVVAVPEGLPLAVTVSLAYSVRKMARDKNLVRKLASCETMGAATVILTDKTGTLTKNRMTVVAAWIAGKWFDHAPTQSEIDPAHLEVLAEIASIDSTAHIEEKNGLVTYVGNPTEGALLAWMASLNVPWKTIRDEARVVHRMGFTSERKRMSTLIARADGAHRLLLKGAPEVLIDSAAGLDLDQKDAIRAAAAELSRAGRRTLALAYRDLDRPSVSLDAGELERDLTLVAILGIDDPIRPEVKDAIRVCRGAGVEVKIITGDNKLTAESIAREVGLLQEGDLVMDGADMRSKNDAQLLADVARLRVLARSNPSDKHRLVNIMRAGGAVVAATGDGTNDAPALKAADVGFAMGLSGTEVAKEASDIVILDDNFASIARAILWGRSIFENIRKFLQFQLTVNVVALTTAFFAAVFGFGIPLNTVQLLWVNLIMDTLAALALATEPPSSALYKQPPHGRTAPLITASMWINIGVMGAYMVLILFLVMGTDLFVSPHTTEAQKLTLVFNVFVIMQLFNEVNARSTRFQSATRDLGKSRLFLAVLGTTSVVQVLIVSFGGSVFKTEPLDLRLWIESVLLGASTLMVGMIVRAVGRNAAKGGRS